MKLPFGETGVNRRSFLKGSGLAALGVTVVPLSALLGSTNAAAGAMPFKALSPAIAKTLQKMARDIFPHDKLAEKFYHQAIMPLDAEAGKDGATSKLLADGVTALDAAARQRYGHAYADVARETDRVALLKSIEPSPFFQKVRGSLVTGLYNNKAVWPLLGYEGSSWEKGGYLHRGFNDISWL